MVVSLSAVVPHTKQPLEFFLHKRLGWKQYRITTGEVVWILLWFGILALEWGARFNKTLAATSREELRIYIRPFGETNLLLLSVQYLLPLRNYSPLEILFGMPYERAVFYHRWNGRLFYISMLIHMSLAFERFGKNIFTFEPDLYGFIAAVIFTVMLVFTVRPIRRKFWELFFFTHYLMYAATAFALAHVFYLNDLDIIDSKVTPSILIICVVVHWIDLIWRVARSQLSKPQLISTDGSLVEVTKVEWKKDGFKFEPGQYVFVTFPEISHLQIHPFSISASPTDDTFSLHIKDSGGFTHAVKEHALSNKLTKMNVDGPYGRLSINLKEYSVYLLVCGGVGVTPMMSILKYLHASSEQQSLKKKVYFVWTVRDPQCFQWFPDFLNVAQSTAQFDIRLHATKAPGDYVPEDGIQFSKQRPNFSVLFSEIAAVNSSHVAVLACGPKPMVDEISQLSASASSSSSTKFHYHSETFAF